MTEQDESQESAFLRTVFEARNWRRYSSRTKILSSSDPDAWESIDFPVEVALELTNYCNLKCVMCPVPHLNRERGFMEEIVFRKVVEGVAGESGFLFLPQGFGESLLHPKWFDLIDFASTMKIRPIAVLTNGMLLREEKISALIDRADIIVVTIDGTTARTYESVRINGSFTVVTKNIETFLKMRGKAKKPHLVLRMIRMRDTEEETEAFRLFWSGRIGSGDIIQVSDCIDWAGSVTYRGVRENHMQKKRGPCRMLWKNLTVYHDGRVSPCCYDAEGELIVGDVREQSPRELWNSPVLKKMRDLHLTGQFDKLSTCARCKNWQ